MSGAPIEGGVFVAVAGPSGAGKDSLIAFARQRLGSDPRFLFVRRVVTRPADAVSEDHESLEPQNFETAVREGRFALHWVAHGLRYGLPVDMDEAMGDSRVIVANVSRQVVPDLRLRYRRVTVVLVTAEAATLALRLAGRAREAPGAIDARLERTATRPGGDGVIELDNSGPLDIAGERFVTLLLDEAAGLAG